jgi:DNA-binding response OmpR family regulator
VTDRHTVLVVDDEPDVVLLCRLNLEFEGYRVLEAASGEAALATLAEELPDVVLLDVALPELDGWQVLEAIKADPRTRGVPVVMLTGRTHEHDLVRGWSAGAAEYVTKPFSPRALTRVVRDVLDTPPAEERRRRELALDRLTLLLDLAAVDRVDEVDEVDEPRGR